LINVFIRRRFSLRRDVFLTADGTNATAPRRVVHLEKRRVDQLFRVAESDAGDVEGADEVDPPSDVRFLVDPADDWTQLATEMDENR